MLQSVELGQYVKYDVDNQIWVVSKIEPDMFCSLIRHDDHREGISLTDLSPFTKADKRLDPIEIGDDRLCWKFLVQNGKLPETSSLDDGQAYFMGLGELGCSACSLVEFCPVCITNDEEEEIEWRRRPD